MTAAGPIPLDGEEPHILVIDDDDRIRSLLKRYLSQQGFRVSGAKDAAEARRAMGGLAFDLLVLDVMMPGISGMEFAREIRGHSSVPILFLTARGEVRDRLEGLETGADDYLTKPFEPRELVLRIRSILRRTAEPEKALEVVQLGPFRFHLERGELTREGKSIKLTSAEAALLKLLATEAGKAFSRSDLAERLGAGLERSIDVQVNRLRRKIEQDPKLPLYLQTVRGIGYVLMPD